MQCENKCYQVLLRVVLFQAVTSLTFSNPEILAEIRERPSAGA